MRFRIPTGFLHVWIHLIILIVVKIFWKFALQVGPFRSGENFIKAVLSALSPSKPLVMFNCVHTAFANVSMHLQVDFCVKIVRYHVFAFAELAILCSTMLNIVVQRIVASLCNVGVMP